MYPVWTKLLHLYIIILQQIQIQNDEVCISFLFLFLIKKRLKIYFMSQYKLFLYQWTAILIDKHVPGVFIIM